MEDPACCGFESPTSVDDRSGSGSRRPHIQHHLRSRQLQPPRRPRAVPVRRLTVRRNDDADIRIGSSITMEAAPLTSPVESAATTVQLDLTGVNGVRAEVAFNVSLQALSSSAGAPPASAAAISDTASDPGDSGWWEGSATFVGGRFGSCIGGGSFVHIRNPLCVPRCSDNLSTWRTCMVPIADLEGFAFMKPPRQRWRHLAQPCQPASRIPDGSSSPSSLVAASSLVFTLMCYNILSDQYASSKSYWYCPDWALAWPYRRQGILETIGNFLPSVLCLQEVETEQFYLFFQPDLAKRGYEGIFSPKSRARTMDTRLRKRVDGCAIFWKRSEFRLVEHRLIELNQQYLEQCWTPHAGTPAAGGAASSEIFSRVAQRDNIALAAVLEPAAASTCGSGSDGGGRLLVCNCHVHWDPQHPDVKLIQTLLLTGALADIVRRHNGALPLILCGDFNSLPQSGVIEFLSLGSVPRDHPDFCCLGEDPSLDGLQAVVGAAPATVATAPSALPDEGSPRKAPARPTRFSHGLRLQSCYSGVDTTYTNYTRDFRGVIDYIFATRDHFRVLDCLDGLADWLRSESVIGCPNAYTPSDHIPLMVRLQLLMAERPN